MKNAVYYLAMHLIQIYGSNHSPCSEPQLIVKETHCHSSNTTERTMQVITDELLSATNFTEAILINEDCSLTEFDTHFKITDKFYIDCEVENIDCKEDMPKAKNNTFLIECEAPETRAYVLQDILAKKLMMMNTDHTKENGPSHILILAASLAVGGAVVASGLLFYKLRTIFQSGTYLFPGPEMA